MRVLGLKKITLVLSTGYLLDRLTVSSYMRVFGCDGDLAGPPCDLAKIAKVIFAISPCFYLAFILARKLIEPSGSGLSFCLFLFSLEILIEWMRRFAFYVLRT
jgi:hypothetical protein